MPKISRRRAHCKAISQRFSTNEDAGDGTDYSDFEESLESTTKAVKDLPVVNFREENVMNDIGDLFELCRAHCPIKYLSVLLYMTMKRFDIGWQQSNEFLSAIGGLTVETAHKWTQIYIHGDFDDFCSENRGGKHSDGFYDLFPDIEIEAKSFVLQRCSQKTSNFVVNDLGNFIDEKFYLTTDIVKVKDAPLVRSIAACRLDMRNWGARYDSTGNRPYFAGHERPDVVEHRNEFVKYFLSRANNYFTITNGDMPQWHYPVGDSPTILIFHDESTFRSGEIHHKRWFFGDGAPLYNKGRGRSNMVSDFIVMHPSGPFFRLNAAEFAEAVKHYPQLRTKCDIDYVEGSATASIHVGHDAYFDNATVLQQFERLFQMIKFKQAFKGHIIECVVDNARTHTAKSHSVFDFGKGVGTRCPVNTIEYVDDRGMKRSLSCLFDAGPNKGLSKGLLELAREIKIRIPPGATLQCIRELLAKHPAFNT
ncbi:unnamed protein product, partial [Adineta ricciae]